MVFISSDGSPEGQKRVQRKNLKVRQLAGQTDAYIRDFYKSLEPAEKDALRDFLKSYERLRKTRWYKVKFAALRQNLDMWISQQPAHADVMQAGLKAFPTTEQILSVVHGIEPLE